LLGIVFLSVIVVRYWLYDPDRKMVFFSRDVGVRDWIQGRVHLGIHLGGKLTDGMAVRREDAGGGCALCCAECKAQKYW
jgi:hypothetical protein